MCGLCGRVIIVVAVTLDWTQQPTPTLWVRDCSLTLTPASLFPFYRTGRTCARCTSSPPWASLSASSKRCRCAALAVLRDCWFTRVPLPPRVALFAILLRYSFALGTISPDVLLPWLAACFAWGTCVSFGSGYDLFTHMKACQALCELLSGAWRLRREKKAGDVLVERA